MKKILLLLLVVCFSLNAAYADKYPVKITPSAFLSSEKDAVQVGDWIDFQVVNDVYVNDKLYIKKLTPVVGIVDFVHQNGWVEDTAEYKFTTFYTWDVTGKKVTISYPLKISGQILTDSHIKKVVQQYIFGIIRGAEINIKPNEETFNIFLTL